MKRKTIKDENIAGVHTVIETVEQVPEDGVVSERELHNIGGDKIGKYHYGVSKHTIITTNNPNITRPVIYGFCTLFLILGIGLLLAKIYWLGIIFIMFAILGFIIAKRDIDAIEEEIRKQGGNVIRENAKEDVKEYVENVKDGIEESRKSVLTKENFKFFSKISIWCMTIIVSIVSIIIALVVDVKLGVSIFAICIFLTMIFIYIISKLFKY